MRVFTVHEIRDKGKALTDDPAGDSGETFEVAVLSRKSMTTPNYHEQNSQQSDPCKTRLSSTTYIKKMLSCKYKIMFSFHLMLISILIFNSDESFAKNQSEMWISSSTSDFSHHAAFNVKNGISL